MYRRPSNKTFLNYNIKVENDMMGKMKIEDKRDEEYKIRIDNIDKLIIGNKDIVE